MRTRSLDTRLSRLEEVMPQGCATCRDWSPDQLGIRFEDHTGAERHSPFDPRPETCSTCGREVSLGHVILIRVRPDGPQ